MSGFEFTSEGIKPFGGGEAVDPEKTLFLDIRTNGEGGDPSAQAAPAEPQQPTRKPLLLQYDLPVGTRPPKQKSVVAQARARRKELRALLKTAKRWQKELDQLERLIAAADGRQLAAVKNIDSRRAS